MKLNFVPNQDNQIDAIKAIVDVFEGQPLNNDQLSLNNEQFEGSVLFNVFGIGNNLILEKDRYTGIYKQFMQ